MKILMLGVDVNGNLTMIGFPITPNSLPPPVTQTVPPALVPQSPAPKK